MSHLLLKLWKDDSGIVALEYLLLATIVALGLVVGLAALESALNAELSEGANAIQGLSQGYEVGTQSNCLATRQGSRALDTPGHSTFSVVAPTGVTTTPSSIDMNVCP
jgi:Flp pilus assembly pilin Flp